METPKDDEILEQEAALVQSEPVKKQSNKQLNILKMQQKIELEKARLDKLDEPSVKKPRSQAQIDATNKMRLSLSKKRDDNQDAKKELKSEYIEIAAKLKQKQKEKETIKEVRKIIREKKPQLELKEDSSEDEPEPQKVVSRPTKQPTQPKQPSYQQQQQQQYQAPQGYQIKFC
jgi:hypothetical protein